MNYKKIKEILKDLDETLFQIQLNEQKKLTLIVVAGKFKEHISEQLDELDELLQALKMNWDRLTADLTIYSNNDSYKHN